MTDTIKDYEGFVIQTATVTVSIGGNELPNKLGVGTAFKADKMSYVQGINYFHLVFPVVGWSKIKWFSYKETLPEPDTDPDPPPVDPSEPSYFIAYDVNGNSLGRYNKQ